MSNRVVEKVMLQIPAQQANPAPPVGAVLGQRGVNIAEFCKQFNDKTKSLEAGAPIPVEISVYKDKSFTFVTKMPPASYLIRKVLGLKKGSGTPGRESAGVITNEQIKKVVEQKLPDLSAGSIDAAIKTIKGTALSMGLKVK